MFQNVLSSGSSNKFFPSILHNFYNLICGLVLHFPLIVFSRLVPSLLSTFLSLHEHRLSNAMRKHLGQETSNLLLEKWILLPLMLKLWMVSLICLINLSCHIFLSSNAVISRHFFMVPSHHICIIFSAICNRDLSETRFFFIWSNPLLWTVPAGIDFFVSVPRAIYYVSHGTYSSFMTFINEQFSIWTRVYLWIMFHSLIFFIWNKQL